MCLSLIADFGWADPILYRPEAKGSHATFHPISYYLNLSFDTAQNPFYFSQSRFFENHSVLWNRVKDPLKAIRESGGWGHFLGEEIFGVRAIPNYGLHVIGGGYDYRWLAEWYEAREVPFPYLVAFLNAYLANIGNEALETSATQVAATDQIADLFFFDLLGKILFLNDGVVRFFYETLQMRAWHFQPLLNLRTWHIDNAGANYIFRPRIFGDSVRPFFHIGMTLLAGLSFAMDNGDSLTAALGISPTDPLEFKGDFIGALYWDHEDDLLASLTVNGSSYLAVRCNIYPDFIPMGDWRLGYYFALSKSKEVFLGVNLLFPAGVSYSF